MSYEDLLRKYQRLDRTRIFGSDWRITQQWTSLQVPWSADYHQTRFLVSVSRSTPVVIVLSQLDRTYFAGLQGQYTFKLQFRVQKTGDEENYIVRSNVDYYMTRSVSTDITLEAGSYHVLMKITAFRGSGHPVDELISDQAEHMRDKFIQVGLSYDIAHAKGVIVETEIEKEQRETSEKAQIAAAREKLKNESRERKEKQWQKDKKRRQRRKMRSKRREKRAEAKAERRRAPKAEANHLPDDAHDARETERDSSALGNETAPVTDRSLTGEFISAYERSEGAQTPATPESEDCANECPANTNGHSHHSDGALSDEKPDVASTESSLRDHPPTPKVQINGVDAVTDVKPLKRRPAPLTPRTTPDRTFDEIDEPQNEDHRQAEPSDDDSDTGSEFSWRTDLDFGSDGQRSPYTRSEPDRDWDRGNESGPDPWNAVCVVGLRVYSKDPDLSLRVIRPNPYSEEDKQEAGGALDRDDPAKGAVAEKWAKTPMRETFSIDSDQYGKDGRLESGCRENAELFV
jgi:hypothetical protein